MATSSRQHTTAQVSLTHEVMEIMLGTRGTGVTSAVYILKAPVRNQEQFIETFGAKVLPALK